MQQKVLSCISCRFLDLAILTDPFTLKPALFPRFGNVSEFNRLREKDVHGKIVHRRCTIRIAEKGEKLKQICLICHSSDPPFDFFKIDGNGGV